MGNYKMINGGVTAPKGFMSSVLTADIKKQGYSDIDMIVSDCSAKAAGVFDISDNDASVMLTRKHLLDNMARALIINNGNGNLYTGALGVKYVHAVAAKAADCLGISVWDVLTASWVTDNHNDIDKQLSICFEIDNKQITVGGMAKCNISSGVKKNNSLIIITTDAVVDGVILQEALRNAARNYPCKAAVCLANGKSGNNEIVNHGYEYHQFAKALNYLYSELAKNIQRDAAAVNTKKQAM